MTAYYNEIDPYAAQWLRNLIKEGLIADGEVDTRSIVDVRPGDLVAFEQCHFFAGLGGWSGALRLAGVADTEPLWTGSCPCQPFSLAGKQKGFADDRHLWPVWLELIRERRPAKVLGEQVASAAQWLRLVRGDLEALGYAVGAIPCEAASAGADHLRDRFWFVGHALGEGELQSEGLERAERRWSGDASYLGDASRSGLEIGSIADQQRGTLRQEGAPIAAAGHRGDAMANADSAAIRIEPGRSGGEGWPGAREHRDDSKADVADSDQLGESEGRQQRSGQLGGTGGDPEACAGDVPDAAGEQARPSGQPRQHSGVEWVIGADGKARRVKSGIRLLAHGVPARVAKLRALGNAIDLRPAAAFIRATM